MNKETDLLNQDFRALVIEEIEGDENKKRKQDAIKRYDCYKDFTKKYVLDVYKAEQGESAYEEIKYRATNISFARSIVNKRAMLYANGAKREVIGDELGQSQVDSIVDMLNINNVMKKVNRYEELFKNAMVQVYPYLDQTDGYWEIKLNVLPPFQYDVIEDANNPEEARVVIFSYYSRGEEASLDSEYHEASDEQVLSFRQGDGKNQIIADSPSDMGSEKQRYVWWSSKYHFTTNNKGEIIPGLQAEDLSNPIGELPFVNFSTEQDGAFWAVGGDDVIEGSILLNVFLTDLYYIAKYQGMGLFYLFGKGVPKNIKIGPSQAITLEVNEGDPNPQIGFATSNPPLDTYMQSVKEYLSALLKTNGLEPAAFMGSDSGMSAQSGIQELIKKSELLEDQENKREIYRDNEPEIFEIYFKWHNYLLDRGLLGPDYVEIGKINEGIDISLKFNQLQSVQTEQEKLDIIQKRRDLELDSLVDSIMRDNPELSTEDAKRRMMEIMETKTMLSRQKMMSSMQTMMGESDGQVSRQSDISSEDGSRGDEEQNTDQE